MVIGPNVTIGNGVKVQNNVSIYEGVTLEDYCLLWAFDGLYQCLQSSERDSSNGRVKTNTGEERGDTWG